MIHFKYHFLLITIFLMSACERKPNIVIPPKNNACDTSNITYSGKVKPILTANCYSCHSDSTASTNGGIDLENFVELKNYMDLHFRLDTSYGSQFYNICNQTIGTKSMPPSYKMSACEIRTIKIWIDAGALNN